MTGFCSECGEAFTMEGMCPTGHGAEMENGVQMIAGVADRITTIVLPKASAARWLMGAGLEYCCYLACFMVLSVTTMVTGGLLDFIIIPFIVIYLSVRDMESGGYSLGKRIGRLRLVDVNTGQPATNNQGFVRNSYFAVLAFITLVPFIRFAPTTFFGLLMTIDVLMILIDPQGRRIGDRLAGTQVVHEELDI